MDKKTADRLADLYKTKLSSGLNTNSRSSTLLRPVGCCVGATACKYVSVTVSNWMLSSTACMAAIRLFQALNASLVSVK